MQGGNGTSASHIGGGSSRLGREYRGCRLSAIGEDAVGELECVLRELAMLNV